MREEEEPTSHPAASTTRSPQRASNDNPMSASLQIDTSQSKQASVNLASRMGHALAKKP